MKYIYNFLLACICPWISSAYSLQELILKLFTEFMDSILVLWLRCFIRYSTTQKRNNDKWHCYGAFHRQDFKYAIPWVEALAPAWEPFSSPKSERSIQTEWCWRSPSFHPQRYPTLLLSRTMPLCQFISSLRTQMSVWFWITRPSMISASARSSSPLLLVNHYGFFQLIHVDNLVLIVMVVFLQLVILTTLSPLPWVVSRAVSDSQVNSTPTWGNLQSILSLSLDSISSWLGSHPWPLVGPSSTGHLQYPNSRSRCGMPRTWCVLRTHAMDVTWLPQPCSEARWALKKSTSRWSMCRTRTRPILSSGSQTMWSLASATSLPPV